MGVTKNRFLEGGFINNILDNVSTQVNKYIGLVLFTNQMKNCHMIIFKGLLRSSAENHEALDIKTMSTSWRGGGGGYSTLLTALVEEDSGLVQTATKVVSHTLLQFFSIA